MKKGKEGEVNLPAIILSVFAVLTVFLGVYVYFALNGPDYTATYIQRLSEGIIQNPISELQLEEDASLENKSLSDIIHIEGIEEKIDLGRLEDKSINYMSVKLYLYNLHNIPLTNNNPRIQVYLDNTPYSVEVIKGEIYIKKQEIPNPDVIIRTTMDEVAKIVDNPEYAKGSLNSGKSSVEIVADNLTLLLKGYAKIYSKILELSE
jgi:hypothetical protein